MTKRQDIPELLAPARDREAFLAAVAAGANAIYCGVSGGLNARRKAAGIAESELAELCDFAHAHGVRVYVTSNIVAKQEELAWAVEAIARYMAAGADAFIIQDWGLMAAVRSALPHAEIHVSTQANVHDARGVALCAELGATRVTLSRELPLAEIAAIARAERERATATGSDPCELEAFAHGAICPSYSGICMLSSFLREGRSPNRGLCAQPCRLPFDLVGEEGVRLQPAERERPLCTHDNCAIDDVTALAAAGVASLKLEGRMKPAAYVHAVTSAWRARLDELAAGDRDEAAADPESHRALKRSFNRGLTDAYLRGTSGNELMSYERSGNRGELVGTVKGFEPEPGFVPRDGQQMRGEVLVRLTDSVGVGDSLELRHPAEPTRFLVVEVPRDAGAGETLRVRVPRPMPVGCEARVTKSVSLERAAATAVAEAEAEFESALQGVEALGRGSAGGATASGSFTLGGKAASVVACGSPTPSGGDSSRAQAPASARAASASATRTARVAPELCVLVSRVDDAKPLQAAGAAHVYLDVTDIELTAQTLSLAREAGLIPVLDEVCREPDHARTDAWIAAGLPVVVGNVSELALARARGAKAELRSCIPVHNAQTLEFMAGLGARSAWLSPELSLAEIRELATDSPLELGLLVYGRPRLMTCEHCVLQVAYDCNRDHERCAYRERKHWLVNIDDRHLPVRTDVRGRSRIYLDKPLDHLSRAHELAQAGMSRLLVDATTVDVSEAAAALSKLQRVFSGEALASEGNDGLLATGVA